MHETQATAWMCTEALIMTRHEHESGEDICGTDYHEEPASAHICLQNNSLMLHMENVKKNPTQSWMISNWLTLHYAVEE